MPGEFAADVRAEAEQAAASPRLPDLDLTDVPFATLDPPGSRDLDQAYAIERVAETGGYRVRYAIADVAAFVTAGGLVDAEAQRRVETLYAPGPAHPVVPAGAQRGRRVAAAGTDPAGTGLDARPRPRTASSPTPTCGVRSCAAASSRTTRPCRRSSTPGTAPEPVALLKEVGLLRLERQRQRGGMSLRGADAGGRAGPVRRLAARVPRQPRGRGLERPDVPADRDRRRAPDARRPGRRPAHDAARGPARRHAAASGRPRPRHRLGRRRVVRLRARPPRREPACRPRPGRRLRDRGGGAVPRGGVHGVRRDAPGGDDSRGDRCAVRPLHRAAAPARRPVRR